MSEAPKVDTRREEIAGTGWVDSDGFVGPLPPGHGARSSPLGEFPTGPAIGERLPDIVVADSAGRMVDVHAARGNGPAVVDFFRSTVW